ncbi:hypothetical protein COM62_27230 [Bacillus pseudomycoides]|uniref:hypothetical protein n=1 Tax=Bacillus pseudomycoides TaxID=64104 RepID=UPI000BF73027|nr:hypothetical protein [Bacillus pseudomycoides]PGE93354.1 hypothetical protein COM62_27230 [Bacillus pseudomycoides]
MSDIISDVMGGLIMSIPSKKEKIVRQNLKLLREEAWFKEIEQRYGRLMIFNYSIREFIGKENLEMILKDVSEANKFQNELEVLLKKEKI